MKAITITELAAMLGVSRHTVARMKAAGELPPTIPTSRRFVRWLASDVELWINLDCPRVAEHADLLFPAEH